VEIRKTAFLVENILREAGREVSGPVRRVAALAVLRNPYAGGYAADLSALFDISARVGEVLMEDMVRLLGSPAVAYGKGAIVGTAGDIEHAAAILHPMLGRPVRAAIGGGAALIPSNAKVAAAGTPIDIPIGNKDNAWSFDEIDTITLGLADAPRADEILLAIVIANAGRPGPRVGKGRPA
jgi:hypothetical protein